MDTDETTILTWVNVEGKALTKAYAEKGVTKFDEEDTREENANCNPLSSIELRGGGGKDDREKPGYSDGSDKADGELNDEVFQSDLLRGDHLGL